MEWIRLFWASLAMAAVLVVPGFPIAEASFCSRAVALAVSPCLSIALYVLIGISLGLFNLSVGALTLPILALAVSLLVAVLQRSFRDRGAFALAPVHDRAFGKLEVLSLRALSLYVFAGLIAAFFYFIMCLDGPGSFANASDSCAHLNFVRAFADSGTYSTLKVASDASAVSTGGFYPAAWHILAAVAVFFTGGSVTMAANSVNFLILSFLFPSASALILGTLFSDRPLEFRMGSLASICFVGFPWIFLVWGQLVSNLLGFALVPVFVFLFKGLLFPGEANARNHIVLPLLLSGVSLVFSQPNSIFTAGIFCIPLIVRWLRQLIEDKSCNVSASRWVCPIALLGVAVLWVVFYKAPFMRSVILVNWHPSNSITQAIVNTVFLAYGSLQTAQPLLALLVALGFLRLMGDEKRRPLCYVFLFCFLIHVANSTNGFPYSRLLAGFWYNDPYRTGAMLAMASVPLAATGLGACASRVTSFVSEPCGRRSRIYVYAAQVVMLACALMFPSYELLGYGTRRTGFGSMSELMTSLYLHDNPEGIDKAEWEFLSKVQSLVGDDLVFNIPEDGSGVLYGVSGMNVLFRRFPGASCERYPLTLGENLCDISANAGVRAKVSALGVKYVMMLDCHANEGEGSFVAYANDPDIWKGVYSIDESTPGFKLLLSEGDMRLYQIDEDQLD